MISPLTTPENKETAFRPRKPTMSPSSRLLIVISTDIATDRTHRCGRHPWISGSIAPVNIASSVWAAARGSKLVFGETGQMARRARPMGKRTEQDMRIDRDPSRRQIDALQSPPGGRWNHPIKHIAMPIAGTNSPKLQVHARNRIASRPLGRKSLSGLAVLLDRNQEKPRFLGHLDPIFFRLLARNLEPPAELRTRPQHRPSAGVIARSHGIQQAGD
jgi:hypothetical protein